MNDYTTPWRVEPEGMIVDGENEPVAVMAGPARPLREVRANASLIAAAPELLAALRECETDEGARCLNDDPRGERARRRLYAINDVVYEALAKVQP